MIKARYADYKVHEVEAIDYERGDRMYEVEVSNAENAFELIFDDKGNIRRATPENQGDDDEEDDD